jgi:hypothetical protein
VNEAEALKLCRMAKAFFPQMAMDEYTPAAWALAFKGDRYADAELALTQLAREEPFIDVAAIAKRIHRIRRDRVLDFGTPPDPPRDMDPDDTLAYRRWLRETQRRIADGEAVESPQIQGVPMPKELASGMERFGRMPEDSA